MSEVDLFDQIRIMAMSEAEKIELMNNGPEYLKILSKDDSMGIRLRAKARLRMITDTDEEHDNRIRMEIADLQEAAKSPVFGTRVKAKILLQKIEEEKAEVWEKLKHVPQPKGSTFDNDISSLYPSMMDTILSISKEEVDPNNVTIKILKSR